MLTRPGGEEPEYRSETGQAGTKAVDVAQEALNLDAEGTQKLASMALEQCVISMP